MSDYSTQQDEAAGCFGALLFLAVILGSGMWITSCSNDEKYERKLASLSSSVSTLKSEKYDYAQVLRENRTLKADVRELNTKLNDLSRSVVTNNSYGSRNSTVRYVGQKGPRGDKGPQGEPGGPRGPRGFVGSRGATGAQGPRGASGPQGLKGEAGGPVGPQGPTGKNGSNGIDGAPGPRGLKGDRGLQGAPGPQGGPGATGKAGIDGLDGTLPIWELCVSISLCLLGLYLARAIIDLATNKYQERNGNIHFLFRKGTTR